MKMKYFGLNETKLFHFHGIFKKNEIKSAKRNPDPFIHMNPLENPGSAPEFWAWLGNRLISYDVFCIIPAELRQARNAGFKFCLGCSKIDHDNNCHSLDVCKPDAVSLVTKN